MSPNRHHPPHAKSGDAAPRGARRRSRAIVSPLAVLAVAGSVSFTAAAFGSDTGMPAPAAPHAAAPATPAIPSGMSRGVVTPQGNVDPGMATRPPRMPPSSTPVIHPHATGDGGSVVVPR